MLLIASAVLVIVGLVLDNSIVLTVGWALWAVGLVVFWATSKGRFGLPALMNRNAANYEAKLRRAAQAGDLRAMRPLASLCKLSGRLDEAEVWLRKGAQAGDREAMFDMGRLVDQREGLAASEPWFRMAADAGHPVAQRFFVEGGAFTHGRPDESA